MLDFITIRSGLFRSDVALCRELLELTAPSYEDPSALIARELGHCDTLYLARDDEGVCGFFLAAWETLEVAECGRVPALYLGLSAARENAKYRGHISALYLRCFNDAVAWEQETGEQLILWGTTATPSVYLAARAVLAATQPRLNGSYSSAGAVMAQALRRKLALAEEQAGHPFVLKNVAVGTRYSRQEAERIERVCQTKNFSLFRELGIAESAGDRLLFIAHTPGRAGFNNFAR